MHCQQQHRSCDVMKCTLCRSRKLGTDVLRKATERKMEWPQNNLLASDNPVQDPMTYTSIDDAFSTIMQCLSTTSRQCKRYYKSCSPQSLDTCDENHCRRFHTTQYTNIQHRNPLETAEDVHLLVQPGTYAVSAGAWGTQHQQTHVVHADNGQSVNFNFVM